MMAFTGAGAELAKNYFDGFGAGSTRRAQCSSSGLQDATCSSFAARAVLSTAFCWAGVLNSAKRCGLMLELCPRVYVCQRSSGAACCVKVAAHAC